MEPCNACFNLSPIQSAEEARATAAAAAKEEQIAAAAAKKEAAAQARLAKVAAQKVSLQNYMC